MMNKSKGKNSHSKGKKKVREANSYKLKYKTKVKEKSNLNSKEKDKDKIKSKKLSKSKISINNYAQKEASSIIKEYNSQNNKNNNALSHSNYILSDMDKSKKNEINNIFCESSKYYDEEYNTLFNNNNKMNINDLNNTNNKKLSERQNNNDVKKKENNIEFQKMKFCKKAAYSMVNENEKMFDNNSYNRSNHIKRYNYDSNLQKLENRLNNEIEKKYLDKIDIINTDINFKKENENVTSNSKNNIKNIELNFNYDKNIIPSLNVINEKNNLNCKEIYNNKYEREQNINNSRNKMNIKNEIDKEFEEKIKILHNKIYKRDKDESESEISKTIDNSLKYENQFTYQNLKRYRQKSECSLRTVKNDKNEFDLNSEKNRPIRNINNYEENKNLDKFRILIDDLKTDISTKRMIDILLKQQNNKELKNILSELQITINKLPDNKKNKEDKLSTLPANYLFPYNSNIINYKKNNIKNMKFDVNKDISEINRNRKIEKLKDRFNDFQQIINKKYKNKNCTNEININYNENQKVFNDLYPANNVHNDLFIIDKL